MEDKTIVKLWVVTVVAVLQAIAIIWAVDGAYFALVIAVIAGVGGQTIGYERHKQAVLAQNGIAPKTGARKG